VDNKKGQSTEGGGINKINSKPQHISADFCKPFVFFILCSIFIRFISLEMGTRIALKNGFRLFSFTVHSISSNVSSDEMLFCNFKEDS